MAPATPPTIRRANTTAIGTTGERFWGTTGLPPAVRVSASATTSEATPSRANEPEDCAIPRYCPEAPEKERGGGGIAAPLNTDSNIMRRVGLAKASSSEAKLATEGVR